MRVLQSRLFWAINLPVDLKRKLGNLQSCLKTAPVNIKWVEQHNLHLTVKFLGDVDDSRVSEITRAVNEAAGGLGSFKLELSGIGFFPGPRRPRVIWVGVQGEVHKLRLLHRRVEECMAGLGWDSNSQGFAPHLTLGRLRTPQGGEMLAGKADKLASQLGVIGSLTVSGIDLMKSRLTRNGPVYQVLVSVKI
ncbi:RNA 2',3'-cyclic phosphodiesterase [Desulfallas gibsoniae]|uniref:RNA 2',3'-cyclic phosphodiesterase n=1 Tax=Desulfoscipio gibsoniae DSM 7213 TaxID=767817 RepID=R4KCG8_9FIRM|nr:2'-5' RNA ligase [Desulfoscipio gibsoniae DSM 7213]